MIRLEILFASKTNLLLLQPLPYCLACLRRNVPGSMTVPGRGKPWSTPLNGTRLAPPLLSEVAIHLCACENALLCALEKKTEPNLPSATKDPVRSWPAGLSA